MTEPSGRSNAPRCCVSSRHEGVAGGSDVDTAPAIRLMALQLGPEDQAHLDRVRRRTVMIATPIARAPVWQYTLALAETCVLLNGLGVRFHYVTVVGVSNLPRARNILTARFLASDATDLLFIDDDVGWDRHDVVRLLAADQPLIAGVIRKKSDNAHETAGWCCEFLPDAGERLARDARGNIEVARAGTGFLRIERRVFAELMARHPEWKSSAAPKLPPDEDRFYYRFFRFGEDELTEDYVFCDRWRAAGGRVFIDPTLRLSHIGEKVYSGAIVELIAPRPAP